MNKTAFMTVVFPGVEPFLDDFFYSLISQTCTDFDLFIINDKLPGANDLLGKYSFPFRIKLIEYSSSHAKNRLYGIEKIKDNGYENIIFGDADDFFQENRVEIVIKLLKNSDFVVNDLTVTDSKGKTINDYYFSGRLGLEFPFSDKFLVDKNIAGFSNTAAKTHLFGNIPVSDSLIAVDWFIFFNTLARSNSGGFFTSETRTFYRQHENNVAGIFDKNYFPERVLHELNVKTIHYKELCQTIPKFNEFYKKYNSLYFQLRNDTQLLNNYIDNLNNNLIKQPFWWENVRLPEEFT